MIFASISTIILEKCSYSGIINAGTLTGYGTWCGLLSLGCAGDVDLTVNESNFCGTANTTFNGTGRKLEHKFGDGNFIIGTWQNITDDFNALTSNAPTTFNYSNKK